jgi:hypothetical protein
MLLAWRPAYDARFCMGQKIGISHGVTVCSYSYLTEGWTEFLLLPGSKKEKSIASNIVYEL